ncbi:MAG: CoA pyrophosphatase [Quisquiliibacterium sp.]
MTAMLDLESIARRISESVPVVIDSSRFRRRAAVAAILRRNQSDTEVLFIKRAQRPGDIFSAQMAFPGGHWEQGDPDLCATAIRETHEEIGLDLAQHGRLLGHLDFMDVTPVGRHEPMLIAPYLFALQADLPQLRFNHEVAAVHWGSLRSMVTGDAATSRDMWVRSRLSSYPGFAVDGEIVWGFTYQMLQGFLRLIGPPAN